MNGNDQETVIIDRSRVKTLLLTLIAVAFVGLCAWLLTLDADRIRESRRFGSPVLIYGVAGVGIAFFGAAGVYAIRSLFDSSPALILDDRGVTDHSSAVAAGLIPWTEIVDVGEYQVQRQKFVSLVVRDPSPYLERGNALQRKLHRANLKMSGTPINLSAGTMKASHGELLDLLRSRWIAHGAVGDSGR